MIRFPKARAEPWHNPSAEPYIVLDGVSKNYGPTQAVNKVSLSLYKGELFALLGGSGCGKSTLLRILAGFETPTEGRIWIDGQDVTDWPPYQRPVNMMFQSYALFPHMNVFDNVAFGLRQEHLPTERIRERTLEGLSLVQMEGLAERKPSELSGGQKQRVALARSLVKRPKLLLLDEPLAALDKRLREQTQFELVNIQEQVGITFVMVTHDQEEAMTMASRMAIMKHGTIRQVGPPHDVYEFPRSRYVAQFIGSMNLFDGVVEEEQDDHVLIRSGEVECPLQVSHAGSLPVGSHVTVGIRPEKIMLSKTPHPNVNNFTKGVVQEIAYLGDMSIYHVLLETGKIVQSSWPNLRRFSERDITWEDEVYLQWKPENGVVLSL